MDFNYLDIILIIPLIYALIRGLFRGLIKEVLSLLSIVLGVVLAYIYAADLAQYLSNSFSWEPGWVKVVAYLMIFSLTMILGSLTARYLTSVSKIMALGFLNRLGGGLFSFVKVLLLMLLIIHLLEPTLSSWKKNYPIWQNSDVYNLMEENSQIAGRLLTNFSDTSRMDADWDFPTLETP